MCRQKVVRHPKTYFFHFGNVFENRIFDLFIVCLYACRVCLSSHILLHSTKYFEIFKFQILRRDSHEILIFNCFYNLISYLIND